MKIGSVCSGYEGLGAAVQAAIGGELAFVADIDPDASKLLAYRFPDVRNLGDIKAVDWVSLGAVDIFCGGFPCQPFSAAGRRLGTADERHLWPYLAKAIGILMPPLVVLENVYGHLTLGFDVVLADLAALGYDAEWVVITASAAGACHRRARLFILAFPASARAVAGVPVAVIRDGAWLEPCESLFGAVPFTGRIPASGQMTAGRIYASEDGPTAMAARLLKTPTAQLAINGGSQHPVKRRAGGHGPTLADQVEHELLPTPRVQSGGGAGAVDPRQRPNGANLATAVGELLPTPTAREKGGRNARHGDSGHGDDLPEAIRYLPTPSATDGKGGSGAAGRTRDGRPRTTGDADLTEAVALLPTPAARDGKGRDMPGRAGGKSLPETLLPTPRATDGTKGGPNQRGSSGDLMLPSAVMSLLPTPTAADGDRTSTVYPRGDATLLGALLPAPQATDGQGGPRAVPEERTHRGTDHGPRLRDVAPALLPTPSVADGTGGHTSRSGNRKGEPLLGGIGMLLPTPTARDSEGARNATAARTDVKPSTNDAGWTLSDVVWQGDLPPNADADRLLPTPAAGNFNDGEDLASWESRRQRNLAKGVNGNGQGTPLPVAAQQVAGATDWGPYEAAIRRWEAVTGRPAPRPTVPGKTGERLNPALPEWMMGLPAGWITDVPGLSWNAQLRLAGNGVVPAQAELALRILLDRVNFEREAA